jgi:RNA polymerase sigma factor (sigma-70 family)
MNDTDPLKSWFCKEILPSEAALMRFIRRNWRNHSEIAELRQEIYVLVYEQALGERPRNARAYLFATARHHLINRARRAQVVSFETIAELDGATGPVDTITPEQQVGARQELKRLQLALDQLPPRCREVVELRKIDGLSQREAAERMGVSVHCVERQMVRGMRILVDLVLGARAARKRPPRKSLVRKVRP